MPGRIILGLGNPALDSDADVISGSTLTAYQNGTTTLQAIYTSVTVATPLPNPLPADSAGRFFDIWAPNGLTYTFVWKDADGVIIRTWNDIVPLGSTEFSGGTAGGTANAIIVTVADFSSTDGELITFIATADNTGPTTAAVNGGTPIDIVEDTAGGPAALDGGEIVTGNSILLRYDAAGDQLHLVSRPLPGAQGTISPPTLTAQQNDWHPTGLDTAEIIRIVLTGPENISGIDAPASDGRQLVLENIDATDAFTLLAQSASSAAENRFAFTSNITVAPNETVTLRYDMTSLRWRLIARGFTSGAYNYAVFTANGTWTVPGNVTAQTVVKWTLVGGGGGGGGAATADGAPGAGGGSGGKAEAAFTGFTAGQDVTVAIGALGAGGANTGAAGAAGTATSLTYAAQLFFGATGGVGGLGATSAVSKLGGECGTASITIGVSGLTEAYRALSGAQHGGNSLASLTSGGGGGNPFGTGGTPGFLAGAGSPGVGYGAGGSGAYRDGGTNAAGGAGTAGYVLAEWWV